jgi:hypothetical protein
MRPTVASMADQILSDRALNRALLARQGLLARGDTPALEMVERLVGLQAQVPSNPYLALWSRLEAFDPEELSQLLASRAAVRGHLIRPTIHLVSARDCLAQQPLAAPVMDQTLRSGFGAALERAGVDVDAVVAAGRALLAERPHTLAELAERLGPQWPQADVLSLGYAVTFRSRLVQIPPRGLWGRSGPATWAPTERWLGAPLEAGPSTEAVVRRYLAAFGPATVGDMRVWSRLTGLRAVFERMRPELRTFRDERGRELFDVPDGLLPDPDVPAPPRFLPEFDNVALSHEDRSRLFGDARASTPPPRGTWIGTLLVDGFARAGWRLATEADVATLTVEGLARRRTDPAGTRDAIRAEAAGLVALIAPEAKARVDFAR